MILCFFCLSLYCVFLSVIMQGLWIALWFLCAITRISFRWSAHPPIMEPVHFYSIHKLEIWAVHYPPHSPVRISLGHTYSFLFQKFCALTVKFGENSNGVNVISIFFFCSSNGDSQNLLSCGEFPIIFVLYPGIVAVFCWSCSTLSRNLRPLWKNHFKW